MKTIETNQIICSDTLKALRELPDECINLIFADPPYWMRTDGVLHRVNGNEYEGCNDEWDNQFHTLEDYQKFTKNWLLECKRVLKKDGSLWVIGGMQCIYTIGSIMQEIGLWFINDIIWYKKNPTPNFKGTRLNNAHETLLWAVKKQKAKYTFHYKTAKELNLDTVTAEDLANGKRKQLGSVWKIGVCQGEERLKKEDGTKLHSTQKPEELLHRIIAINSNIGDIILDPFGGTMTTGAVAKRMGRRYLCIDNDKKYCEAGQKRIDAVQEQITDIDRAVFDIKPPRVTFSEMIEAGYFKAGEELFYNGIPHYRLSANGKVADANGDLIDIHTAIAKIKNVKAKRLNGWDYWTVLRNDSLISINDIRIQYQREVKHFG